MMVCWPKHVVTVKQNKYFRVGRKPKIILLSLSLLTKHDVICKVSLDCMNSILTI